MKIFLVRHGETFENVQGIMQGQTPGMLTPRGINQAEKLAERFEDENFDMIFTSDLQRAKDTADIIARAHNVPVHITESLRERDYGELTGLNKEKLFEEIERVGLTEDSIRPEGGENYNDMRLRAKSFFEEIFEKYPDKTILLSSHSGFNRTFLSAVLDIPLEEAFQISQRNTCVNIIEIDEYGIGREVLIDCTAHLN